MRSGRFQLFPAGQLLGVIDAAEEPALAAGAGTAGRRCSACSVTRAVRCHSNLRIRSAIFFACKQGSCCGQLAQLSAAAVCSASSSADAQSTGSRLLLSAPASAVVWCAR
jgi:hypothetical protein